MHTLSFARVASAKHFSCKRQNTKKHVLQSTSQNLRKNQKGFWRMQKLTWMSTPHLTFAVMNTFGSRQEIDLDVLPLVQRPMYSTGKTNKCLVFVIYTENQTFCTINWRLDLIIKNNNYDLIIKKIIMKSRFYKLKFYKEQISFRYLNSFLFSCLSFII